jgi:hypothetical protein
MMAGFVVGAPVVSLLVLPRNTLAAQGSTEPGTVHMGIASFHDLLLQRCQQM